MQSRRANGRLVLEAVSVPSQKNFQARRENGRLVLEVTAPDVECNLINPNPAREQQEEEDEAEEVRGSRGGGNDAAEKETAAATEEGIEWIIRKKTEGAVEIAASPLRIDPIGKLTIPKIAIVMNKPDELREVLLIKGGISGGEVAINSMGTVTDTQNVYEYFWRTKKGASAATLSDPGEDTQQQQQQPPPPPTLKSYVNAKKYVISRNDSETASKDGRGEVEIVWKEEDNGRNSVVEDCWVSVMKDSSRRPSFVLGPRCIATS